MFKNLLLISNVVFTLTACVGNSQNPSISIQEVSKSCTNMQQNALCNIQLTFNNGDNNQPLLVYHQQGSASDLPVSPLIESGSSISNCQKIINGTQTNTTGTCDIKLQYTGSTPQSVTIWFDLNGILSNNIMITGVTKIH